MIRITSVKPLDNYKLFLTFTNGQEGIFDAKPYLDEGSVFIELQNISLFNSVRTIYGGTIGWANGADLCPDCVYLGTQFV